MKELSAEALMKILSWATKLSERQIVEAMTTINGATDWQEKAARAMSQYCAGAPLGYIFGEMRYFGRVFRCDSRALAIRPYNELIVRKVIEDWSGRQPRSLEIGCGAGAIIISLSLELEGVFIGSDVEESALELARENASMLQAPVKLIYSDLFDAVGGEFDVIVTNLPWEDPTHPLPEAAWEPDQALYDRSGFKLGLVRRFLAEAPARLRPEGLIYMELPNEPNQQVYFAGEPLALADGEIIGFKMNAAQAVETLNVWKNCSRND